jgi:hypothetical protein
LYEQWPCNNIILSFDDIMFPVLRAEQACWYIPIEPIDDSICYAVFFDGPKNHLNIFFFGNKSLQKLLDKAQSNEDTLGLYEKIWDQISHTNSDTCFSDVEVFNIVDRRYLKPDEFRKMDILGGSGGSKIGKELAEINLIGVDF